MAKTTDQDQSRLLYEVPYHQMPDELVRDERTNVYHIAVFSVLAMHAGKDRAAWPSQNRLAKLTGASRNKIKQTVAELERMGWITTRRRFDETTGRYSSTVYCLSPSLQGRSPHDQGVGHDMTKGWSSGAQEPATTNQLQLNQNSRAPARAPKDPAPMKDELARYIDESMRAVQPYENFGRERKQITSIAAACRRRNPDRPQDVADAMMGMLQALRKSGDRFWQRQPFTPSLLMSQWERIEQEGSHIADQYREQREFEEWVNS